MNRQDFLEEEVFNWFEPGQRRGISRQREECRQVLETSSPGESKVRQGRVCL